MAHHQHGQSHLVRRQRDRDDDDNNNQHVETVISVRVVTAQNTYTGKVSWITQEAPKTLIAPAERSRPAVTSAETKPTSKPVETSKQTALLSSIMPSPTPKSDGDDSESTARESNLMVATKSPTPVANTAAAGLATASATISAAASADAQGMSTGAKAGLVLGILVGIGALLVGILLVYRRKKKQVAGAPDNEKLDSHNASAPPLYNQSAPAPVPVFVPQSTPSIRTERSTATAPRLSLRPVTQFDPAFDNSNNSNKNAANGLLAAGPPTPSKERDLPDRPRSAWERPGAASNAPPAENPFNDPLQSGPPSANPFGNNAAVDAAQARIPDSPPNDSPLHSTKPSADFANPAAAIASADVAPIADVDPVAAAVAMAAVPPPTQSLPAPPSINGDGVPPSPAWTDDLPASPGPAPTGPPPVAGAVGARSNNNSPPPNNVHRVQLDFKPSMQDELGLNAGQLVRMLHEYDDGWALCIRMDRSQQGVVPRTCLSKHPVKPRNGPPPSPGPRGPPPMRAPMNAPSTIRPLSPASGRNSPLPPNGRMSPAPRQMSPRTQQGPRARSNSNAPQHGPPRGRSNSNAPYAGPQRSMSPGPYGGGPQMAPPPQMGRPRSNSANMAGARRGPAQGLSPMNPNANGGPMPARKPVPGMAM